ncbi:MAG TPA: hypothetical protein PK014_12540 [Thermoanaerobaculia bacterium]|nr:hypothetical protein [Thermoanaerobaculia bacterium]HUM30897.1 hypothetical protein [Thermoanaerobaculia bacterium]
MWLEGSIPGFGAPPTPRPAEQILSPDSSPNSTVDTGCKVGRYRSDSDPREARVRVY